MGDLLTTISKQFGKSIILSAFLPATAFVIIWGIFVSPLIPSHFLTVEDLVFKDALWSAIAIIFPIVLLAGFLFNFSSHIIRFYEGYPWQNGWYGKRRIRYYQAQFDKIQSRVAGIPSLRVLEGSDIDKQAILDYRDKVNLRLNEAFPEKRDLILPTRLGNVIRSFERYSAKQYGIEAIALWPRLISLLDERYLSAINDAKTSVTFLLNSSMLSSLLAFAIFVAGVLFPPSPFLPLIILPTLLLSFSAYWFYLLSIRQAASWGQLVKAAFDLHRWELLEQLGFQQKNLDRASERVLWKKISQQILFGDKFFPKGARRDRVGYFGATVIQTEPKGISFEITRGTKVIQDKEYAIFFRMQNVDANQRSARKIMVKQVLPNGFNYQWGSAQAVQHRVEVVGENPYEFHISGELLHEAEVVLVYHVVATGL